MQALKTKLSLSLANQKDEGRREVATHTGLEAAKTAFLNFRVDASKRLNESVLIRRTEK